MKTLYFIGGAMGVGKTAASRELKTMLQDSVLLDGDNLWDMHPFTVDGDTKKCVISNIVACLSNFLACPRFKNIIFCWVLHQKEIAEDILSRLNLQGVRVVQISLLCSEHTLLKRLNGDIAAGIRKKDVRARSAAYLPLYADLPTIKIQTDKLTPREVAEVIADL